MKGAPLNAAAMMYAKVVGFAAGIVIARVIGATQYGMINVARSVLESCSIVSPLGLDLAMQRHLGSASEHLAARLGQLRVFRLIAFGIAVIPPLLAATGFSSYVEESIYRYPDFASVLLVTLIALPFATDIAVLGGAYRGVLNPAPFMLANFVVQPTVRLIIMGLLFVLGYRLWAVVVAMSASYIISWAVLAFLAHKDMSARDTDDRLDWIEIRSVLRYAPCLGASLIFVVWIRSADCLFLGYFGSARDVGQYAAILTIAQLIGLVGEALGQTLGPRVALRYRNNDLAAMEYLLAENIRRMTLLSAPIFAAILFWGDRIDLVLGPTFEVDTRVVALVSARIFLQTIFGYSGFALSMTGWHARETVLLGCGFLLSVVLCSVLVPPLGQLGAALASFVTMSMINLVRCAVVLRMFKIRIVGASVATTTVLAVTTAGFVWLLLRAVDTRTLAFTVLEAAVFLVLFAGTAWRLLITDQDRDYIFALFGPFRGLVRIGR
ncbi:oligosaccharide flippase family protein [Bradyrhizobium iriomotense]|uniref:oligosaccharide flippase family protein n=1 Tax=Bradyrhizobium iriomotense TaxID=441950 RepID=UPI001B8A239C|nr:oligosaccharide flippase family protein [Bradyrhizobium iriomotense]MBR1132238.1 oligosaccharide flippase family protein [Bradyrhizobium iriomotense]